MTATASINPRILDSLYGEALVLSDEVRATFALSGRIGQSGLDEDLARVALSCEALRTTTRMMHAIAWLLNHRAFFQGELSEFQLRRHGRLSVEVGRSEPDHCTLLEPPVLLVLLVLLVLSDLRARRVLPISNKICSKYMFVNHR